MILVVLTVSLNHFLDIDLFFFYINNLLHDMHRQTMVATFVTMYRGSILTGKLRKRKEKEKER